jgi:4-amino-4-deoxy-L-arabinose transferase-like glycosyltransferase
MTLKIEKIKRICSDHKDWSMIFALYFIGLIFRFSIIYIIAWDWDLHYEYAEIAKYILAGQGYSWDWYKTLPPQPTAAFVPIYTYFVAFMIAVFAHPARAVYLIQAALSALGVIPAFLLGKKLVDKKTGFVCAGLYSFFPEFVYSSTKMTPEAIMLPAVMIIFYLYLQFKEYLVMRQISYPLILLGAFIGIGALMKESIILMLPACIIGLILVKHSRSSVIRGIIFICLGSAIAIAPWSIRNMVVMKKPIILRTGYGINIWRGNHEGATGTARTSFGENIEYGLDSDYKQYIESNYPKTELELDKFYMTEATKFIRNHPLKYLWLTTKRIVYFFTIDPTHPLTMNIPYIGGYIFALIFGIWGALILKAKGCLDNIFLITTLLFLAFYAPVMMLPRYRMVFTLILIILSSISITEFYPRVIQRFASKTIITSAH